MPLPPAAEIGDDSMDVKNLPTPAFLVDLTVLERNIQAMSVACKAAQTQLWPMIKTHKSACIAGLQLQAGAAGFLVGTLDEAAVLAERGVAQIMLAYPVAGAANIDRVIQLAAKTKLYLTIDDLDQARLMDMALQKAQRKLAFLVKINIGLNRLGIDPDDGVAFLTAMKAYKQLTFAGIATHPGHVYGAADHTAVAAVARQEALVLERIVHDLRAAGFQPLFVATGSTPTAKLVAACGAVNVLRPGNYVFNDAIQIGLGAATEADCSLTVLGTIISRPRNGVLIVDVGSKCLGLDTGAHGKSIVRGFGKIKGHDELCLFALSEQIGKIEVRGATPLVVGDKIEIIPNHACSAANMTNELIGHVQGKVVKTVAIDMRDGSWSRL